MSDTSHSNKRTRTRTPHSKGGCVTCKIRHLKCDQMKPKCMRCSKSGWRCDGYAQPKPPTKPSRQIRTLAPKNIVSQPSSPQPSPASPITLNDEREFQCFEIFRTTVGAQLARFVDDKLWKYIVSQKSESDSPVIHAAIAFGAWSSPEMLEYNREFAFAEYGKALAFLRHALSNTPKKGIPTRQVVVTLLLCVNFEVLAGFAESATQLTIIGINFLESTVLVNMPIHEITSSRSSPIPSINETDMIDGSAPRDISPITFNDPTSAALHDMYQQCSQHSVVNMSGTFSTLQETYLYLGRLVQRALHHLAYVEPNSTEIVPYEQDSLNAS